MLDFFKKPSNQGLLIALFITLIIMWFYFSKIDQGNYYALDNPLEEVISVELDGEIYTMAPFQTLHISLDAGDHGLKSFIKDSLLVSDSFSSKNTIRGLINPTLSPYIIYSQYYGKGINRDSLIRSRTTLLDSISYYGELKEKREVFISDFYLNVDQSFPKLMKSMDTISAMPKIFRKEQFEKFYHTNFD